MFGSPPPCRAAMMIARLSLLHSLPRLASMAPFLCLMVAQWEWPDMVSPSRMRVSARTRQREGEAPAEPLAGRSSRRAGLIPDQARREPRPPNSRFHLPQFGFQFPVMLILASPALAFIQAQRLFPRLLSLERLLQAVVNVTQVVPDHR